MAFSLGSIQTNIPDLISATFRVVLPRALVPKVTWTSISGHTTITSLLVAISVHMQPNVRIICKGTWKKYTKRLSRDHHPV